MKKLLTTALILSPTVALAHPGHGFGLDAGVMHPLTGADHLLAMVGVGLWAAQQQGRARWALPLAFLTAMAAGFGFAVPVVEPMVMTSVILLGLTGALTLLAGLGLVMAG